MLALKAGVSTILIDFPINTKMYLETDQPKVKNESQFLEFYMTISVLTRWIQPFTITVLKISFIHAYSNFSQPFKEESYEEIPANIS